MIGRWALADPWAFRDTHCFLTTGRTPPPPTVAERMAAVVEHFDNLRRLRGPRAAVVQFRQRISWYAKSLPRAKLLRQRMNRIDSPAEFHQVVDDYLAQHGSRAAGFSPRGPYRQRDAESADTRTA